MEDGMKIIKRVSEGNLCSVSKDVEAYLKRFYKSDTAKVLSFVRNLLRSIVTYIKFLKSLSPNEKQNITSACILCLECIKNDHPSSDTMNTQVECVLYHLIEKYLNLKLYQEAVKLSSYLQILFCGYADLSSGKSELRAIINNIIILFRKAAIELEKEADLNFGYNVSLQLRAATLAFCTLCPTEVQGLGNKIYHALQQYYDEKNKSFDPEQVVTFLNTVWEAVMSGSSKTMLSIKKPLYFQIIYKCDSFFMKHPNSLGILAHYPKWLCALKSTVCEISDSSNSAKLLCTAIDISASYFKLLVSQKCMSPQLLAEWNEILNMGMWSDIEMDIIYLMCSFISTRVYVAILEQVKDNETMLLEYIAIAKEMATSVMVLFSSNAISEHPMELHNSVIGIGNLGIICYKRNLFEQAIPFFNSSIQLQLSPRCGNVEWLWKKQDLLNYCYSTAGMYLEALATVAQAFSVHNDKLGDCVKMWLKTKKMAHSSGKGIDIAKTTICGIVKQYKIQLSDKQCLSFLMQEIRSCNYERRNLNDECSAAVSCLLRISPDGLAKARSLALALEYNITHKVDSLHSSEIGSCEAMSQTALEIFENWIAKNPTDATVKLDLSVLYFWIYHLKWMKQKQTAKEEIEVPVETLDEDVRTSGGHVEEKDKNDKCDVVTSFASVTVVAEMELLTFLRKAVSIWLEFCNGSDVPWSQVLDTVHQLNLLNIVRATSKYFAQSANDYNELRALIVLRDMAKSAGNRIFELSALHSILSLVTRLGYLKMAGAIVSHVELNLLPGDIPKDDIFHAEELKFYIAKSNYFLQSEQFHPGLELLLRILKDPFLELNQRTPMVIKAEAQLLSSMYLLLPPDAFSNRDLPTIHFADDTPIRLAVESLKTALRLIRFQSKGPEKKSAYGTDLSYPPELMCLLMRSTVVVGTLYTEIGSPRDARCFLQECLLVSQKSILTYWSSKFLVTLAHVDLLCDNLEDGEMKLRGLKHMLSTSSHSSAVSATSKQSFSNVTPENEESFREKNFLTTRSGRSRKGWIRQKVLKSETVGMSPQFKWSKKDKREVHPESCSCHFCEFFALQMVNLETTALNCQYLLAKGEIVEACAELREVLKTHETIMKNSIIPKAFDLITDITIADSTAKVLRKSDLSVFVHSLISLNQISTDQGDYSKAVSYIGAALNKLNSCAKHSKHMFADLYGSVIYSKIVSLVKILSSSELQTNMLCLASTWFGKKSCPVDLAIPELADEILKLNVGCETPKDTKLPIIDVQDLSSVNSPKSSLTQRMCKAPIKRDLLSTAMKNYLSVAENSPKSSNLSSSSMPFVLNCSNSGDDCAFISPSNSDSEMKDSQHSKIPPRKMRSTIKSKKKPSSKSCNLAPVAEKVSQGTKKTRQVKRLGAEKHNSSNSPDIVYRIFKSRSNVVIKSSGDVWSQSLSDCKGNLPPASHLKKTKTAKPRAPSATAAPRKSTRTRRCIKISDTPEVNYAFSPSSVDFPIAELLCQSSKSPASNSAKELSDEQEQSDYHLEKARGFETPLPEVSHPKKTRGPSASITHECETEEAKFSITRSSVLEPYTPTFSGTPYEKNYRTKPLLTEIAATDLSSIAAVRIEELIFELKEAMLLLEHHPPCPLYGNMCLLLALLSSNTTEGNSNKDRKNKLDMCYLLSESFAVTLRHQSIIRLSKLIREQENNSKDDKKSAQPAPETELPSNLNIIKQKSLNFSRWPTDQHFSDRMKKLQSALPADWTIVQVHAFPEIFNTVKNTYKPQAPKLVLCQYRRDSTPCVSVIDNNADPLFKTNFLSLFETIIRESSLTMTNKDAKEWWTLRRSLDAQMKELTESMENIWLGCWKGLFLGQPSNKERMTQLCKAVCQVKSRAESLGCFHVDKEMLQVILDSTSLLNSQQLSTAVSQLWDLSPTDPVLQNLTKYIDNLSASLPTTSRNPVLLILDKHVQALPWESMPMLKDIPVTRVPSVSLLNAQLESFSLMSNSSFHNGIQSENTFYIVNPGGDLLKTQETFEEIFKQQKGWKGIIGRIPSSDEFKSAITENDLFLYLGHGTGKNYLTGESVEKYPCQATTLLMGCSSGRLKLLGRQFEPAGVVLQYFLGGSPCVVGNLWDVTDKDIDRFTQTLLEIWLPKYGKQSESLVNIATAISTARNSCKLPFLIGAAPVIYGLPVFAKS